MRASSRPWAFRRRRRARAAAGSRSFSPSLGNAADNLWLGGVLAVVLGAAVFFIYRRENRVAGADGSRSQGSGGRLALMLALRLGMFLLMLGVLLPQFRVWFVRQSWPEVVILIDDSASMSKVDDIRDPRLRPPPTVLPS